MQMMEQERIFDLVRVFSLSGRKDERGMMQVVFSQEDLFPDFSIREQRVYQMPKAGTFFGIHYQELTNPQAKLITVIQGAGVDYVVDLRPASPTFRQWKAVELREETKKPSIFPLASGMRFCLPGTIPSSCLRWITPLSKRRRGESIILIHQSGCSCQQIS